MKRFFQTAFFIVFAVTAVPAQDVSEIDIKLLIAAYDGDSAEVKELIEKGANVNTASSENITPLMLASQNGYTPVAAELIRHGAEVNMRTNDGNTALILAIQAGNIETAEFLIRKGADKNLNDEQGVSPLMHAIKVDSFYLPDMLIYYGADVNLSDNNGVTALMLASLYGSFEIAYSLLEAGAEINSSDSNGNTPLHYATSAGNTDIMELLIINGAIIDTKNKTGFSPLSVAVSLDRYAEALLLTGFGADVNSRIRPSLNPLTIAVNNQNDTLARLLRNNGAELLKGPDFSLFTAGTGVTFNTDDSHVAVELGLSDRRFYWMPSISYSFRPKAIKVLEQGDSSEFFQYWERRHFISLDLSRSFFTKRFKWGLTTGAYAGIGGTFTFGSYKGSTEGPATRFLFNPAIGCMLEYEPFRIKIGYEFLNLHLKYYNSNWFSVSLHFLINNKKRNILP